MIFFENKINLKIYKYKRIIVITLIFMKNNFFKNNQSEIVYIKLVLKIKILNNMMIINI